MTGGSLERDRNSYPRSSPPRTVSFAIGAAKSPPSKPTGRAWRRASPTAATTLCLQEVQASTVSDGRRLCITPAAVAEAPRALTPPPSPGHAARIRFVQPLLRPLLLSIEYPLAPPHDADLRRGVDILVDHLSFFGMVSGAAPSVKLSIAPRESSSDALLYTAAELAVQWANMTMAFPHRGAASSSLPKRPSAVASTAVWAALLIACRASVTF